MAAAEPSDDEPKKVNPVERSFRAVDAFQQRTFPLNFLFGVVKKFGDDSAGSQAALIAYYGFLSIFPLLLVMITLLTMFVSPGTEHRIVHSALSQFPIVGNQLSGPNGIHRLKSGSTVGLTIGLVALVWGSLGITQAAQKAMAEVWNVPGVVRPGFFPRLGRSVAFLAVLFLNVIVTTVLTGISTFGGHSPLVRIGAILISLTVDVGIFILAFRVLTPKTIKTDCLIGGAVLAGVRLGRAPVHRDVPGRPPAPPLQPDLRVLRLSSGADRLHLLGRRNHPLRCRGQCGPAAPPLATEHRPAASHHSRPPGPH